MFIESADLILGPNDHIRKKCSVLRQQQSRLGVIFNTYILVRAAEGGQRDEVRATA